MLRLLAIVDAEAERRVAALLAAERASKVVDSSSLMGWQSLIFRVSTNRLLVGHDPEPGIVAVESAGGVEFDRRICSPA